MATPILNIRDWGICGRRLLTRPRRTRLDKEWFLWTLMLGVLPAMISHFVSFTRYVQMAFPAFVAMAFLLKESRRRIWRWFLVGVLAAVHIVLLVRHINFRWAG